MMALNDISDLQVTLGRDAVVSTLLQHRKVADDLLRESQQAETGRRILPRVVSLEGLLTSTLVEPPQLIEGLLHQGSKMVIGGDSKACKTWTLLDQGLSVAAGENWLGLNTAKSRVLYVNMELEDWCLKSRTDFILRSRPELEAAKPNFHIWNLRGCAASLKEIAPAIAAQAGQQYGLIILDPIYKLYGDADENSASDMAALLNELDALIVQTGASVVFAAHFAKGNKANKQAMDRISGSGVFARDPDTILTFTSHENENTLVVEATLRCFRSMKPFCVRWDAPVMRRDDNADPKRLKNPNQKQPTYSKEQLLEALGISSLTNTEWKKECEDRFDMKERTFNVLLKRLKDEGLVSQDTQKRYSVVSPPGTTANAA